MIDQIKEKLVVGTVDACLDHDCTVWIVDSFNKKYWILCLDPKHKQEIKQVEKCGQGCEPSTQSTSSHKHSVHKVNP